MIIGGTLRGIEARVVVVEANTTSSSRRGFFINGMREAAQREARVRVEAALKIARIDVPDSIDVTCDASGTAIDTVGLDLPMALAIAGGAITDVAAIGELSLSGEVRPVRGALAMVEAIAARVCTVFVAPENEREAALVAGVRVVPVRTLGDAIAFARGDAELARCAAAEERGSPAPAPDLSDVVGQAIGRRALEIAAAGDHNVLFVGPPGSGKTMLARRLAPLLPAMTEHEALDVTRAHSAAGLNIGGGVVRARPFRAPHHSTTPPGLVGGGATTPRPGELAIAHNGVLFLDELPEFARATLEVLDEPLASKEIVVLRATGSVRFPALAHVVASMQSCPCGRHGSKTARCHCDDASRARYVGRLPERLLRHFDLRVHLEAVELDVATEGAPREASAPVRERVRRARERLAEHDKTAVGQKLPWEASCARPLARAAESAGGYARAVRVAETIAALDGAARVTPEHFEEARALTSELPMLLGLLAPSARIAHR